MELYQTKKASAQQKKKEITKMKKQPTKWETFANNIQ